MALVLLACSACGGDTSDAGFPDSLDECGSNLDTLLATESDTAPRVDASFSEALADWAFPDAYCGLGVFSGVCADGKRVLYRNGGFASEIRYYAGEQLVGYVGSGDVGFCPSVCPFSHFFGTADSVRCDAPSFEALCQPAPVDGRELWMPFADGQAPGGCEPL